MICPICSRDILGEVNEHVDECLVKKEVQEQDSIKECIALAAKKAPGKKQISLLPYFSP